jgi:ABC-type multidrug transport system fused ATPase/permease subunit
MKMSRESLSVLKEKNESTGIENEDVSSSSSEKSLLTDSELEKTKKQEDEVEAKQIRHRRLHKTKGSVEYLLKPQVQLTLLNVTCHWIKDSAKPNLKNVSCEAFDGELILVTGPVGCGKSTLLSTILGELPVSAGKITCSGKIAHVSQCPWVFSGTIRSNILFGKRYDPRQYEAVLQACDLEKDINSFPDRDATRIGERGTILSGGQRIRIALARAVYSDAEIYLLDDPLGAVDSKVGRNLFELCIQGILAKKIRILVTHQLQVSHMLYGYTIAWT